MTGGVRRSPSHAGVAPGTIGGEQHMGDLRLSARFGTPGDGKAQVTRDHPEAEDAWGEQSPARPRPSWADTGPLPAISRFPLGSAPPPGAAPESQ